MKGIDRSDIGFADPGTVGALVVGLAGRAIVPGLRLLGSTLEMALGVVDAVASPTRTRQVSPARIHFPSD